MDIKTSINGAKVNTCLVSAVYSSPKLCADKDTTQNSMDEINNFFTRTHSKVSKAVLPENASNGLKASLRFHVAEMVSEVWKHAYKSGNESKLNEDLLSDLCIKGFQSTQPAPDVVFSNKLNANVDHEIAVGRAVSKLSPCILRIQSLGRSSELFFGKNSAQDILNKIRDDLVSRSNESCDKLLKGNKESDNEKTKTITFKSYINMYANIYKEVMDNELKTLGNHFKNMNKMSNEKKANELKRLNSYSDGMFFHNVKEKINSIDLYNDADLNSNYGSPK